MPSKRNKSDSSKPSFVVVEEDSTPTTSKKTSILSSEPKDEEKSEGQSQDVVYTESEKVTDKKDIPVSGVTSFKFLDPKADSESESKVESSDMEADKPKEDENTNTNQNIEETTNQVNKWLEDYEEKESISTKKDKSIFKILIIVLLVLSLGAIFAGGFIYYKKNISAKPKETTSTLVETKPSPTSIPSPTPTASLEKVDYSKYSLQILNGSGVPGEAAKVKSMLSSFKFKSINIGNASSYDFEKTVIEIKSNLPTQVFEDLSKALEDSYDIEKETKELPKTSSYDVVITVGIRK